MSYTNKLVVFILVACAHFVVMSAELEKNVVCGRQKYIDLAKLERQTNQAQSISQDLIRFVNDSHAQVAFVSRAGADQSDRQFIEDNNIVSHKYTHIGILFKTPSYQWRFIHLLNDCAGPTSRIVEQSVFDFFTDDPYLYDVMVTIPSIDLQQKILQVINDETIGSEGLARQLHNAKYSKIANPYHNQDFNLHGANTAEYQNSNMWALNIIVSALTGLTTIAEVESSYTRLGYVSSQVILSNTEVLFGGTHANVAISDHTRLEKISRRLNFVSALSIHRFLNHIDKAQVPVHEICFENKCNQPIKNLN